MRLMTRRILAAAGLVAVGWMAGQAAQAPQADFEITVTAPPGETTVTCTRGCGLQFIRTTPDKSKAQPFFTYSCTNTTTCRGSVHGWVIR